MWVLLCASALAGGVRGSVAAQAAANNTDRAAGVSAALGAPLGERLTLEAVAEGQRAASSALAARTRGELRWALPSPGWQPSLLAGAGIAAGGDGIAPQLAAGVALDGPARGRTRLRVQARYLLGVDLAPQAMAVDVGLVWGQPAEAPAAVVAEEAAPHPEHVTDVRQLVTEPDELLVWVPHPYCEWRPASEAEALLASLPGDQHVQVSAEGFLPEVIDLSGSERVTLRPAPTQGAIVVAAGPGDRVQVVTGEDAQPLLIGPQGSGVATLPEGDVTVQIEGWGRREVHEVAAFDGYAMWIQARAPEEERLLFALGSSSLSAAGRARVAELAALAGGWSYQLQGSSSPDGDPRRNAALADARAAAVRDALIEAGLPASRVEMLDPVLSGDRPAEDMRSVILTPVAEPSS